MLKLSSNAGGLPGVVVAKRGTRRKSDGALILMGAVDLFLKEMVLVLFLNEIVLVRLDARDARRSSPSIIQDGKDVTRGGGPGLGRSS